MPKKVIDYINKYTNKSESIYYNIDEASTTNVVGNNMHLCTKKLDKLNSIGYFVPSITYGSAMVATNHYSEFIVNYINHTLISLKKNFPGIKNDNPMLDIIKFDISYTVEDGLNGGKKIHKYY